MVNIKDGIKTDVERESGKRASPDIGRKVGLKEKQKRIEPGDLFYSLPVPTSLMTPEGRRVDTNPATERLFKRSRKEIIGLKAEELYSKEDASKIKEALGKCKRIGSSSCEATCIRGDGTTFPAILNFASTKDEEGNIIHILITATDATELKEKEKKIADAESYHEQVVERTVEGLCVADQEGNWLTTNPAMAGITGYGESELLGRKTLDQPFMQLKEAKEAIKEMLSKVNVGETVIGMEMPWIRKDGKKIIISGSGQQLKDSVGNVIGSVFTAKDVTEERKREAELEASKAYFQSFFNSSPVSLTLIGLDGKKIDCNPTMEELTGRRKEELVNTPIEATYEKETQLLVRQKLVDETLEKGHAQGFEAPLVRPDGTKLPTVANCSLLRDKEGKPLSIIYSATDITELRKQENFTETILENAPIGIVRLDKDGTITYVNPALRETLGFKGLGELKGVGMELAETPGIANTDLAGIVERLLSGEAIRGTYPYTSVYGKESMIRVKGAPLFDLNGKFDGAILLIGDVTELHRSMEALEGEKVFFSTLVEAVPDMIAVLDENGRWIHVNPAWEETWGYKPEELLGKTSMDQPFELPGTKEEIEERNKVRSEKLSRGETTMGELPFLAKDGSVRIGEFRERSLKLNGKILGRIVALRDITEQREREIERAKAMNTFGNVLFKVANGDLLARVELDAIDEEYRAIGEDLNLMINAINKREAELEGTKVDPNAVMDSISVPLYTFDRDTRLTSVNPEFENTLGYSKDEVLGLPIEDFAAKVLPPESVPTISKKVRERVKTGEIVRGVPIDMINKDGERIPCLYSASGIRDLWGEVVGEVVTLSDVTELKKREEELNRLSAMVENSGTPIILLDPTSRWEYVNPIFEKFFGFKKEELLGKTTLETPIVTEEAKEIILGKRKLYGKDVVTYEVPLVKESGEMAQILLTQTCIYDEEDKVTNWVVELKDITELKNKEINLRNAISVFGEVLSSASGGNLSTKVDLSKISEGYKPIGENINSMISAIEENIDELRKREEELKQAVSVFGSVLSKASSGDLSAKVDLSLISEEYAPIAEDINEMVQGLTSMVESIREASDQLSSSSQGIASSAEQVNSSAQQASLTVSQIADGTYNQATRLEEIGSSTREMMSFAQEMAKEMESTAKRMKEAADRAMKGAKDAEGAIQKSEDMSNSISRTVEVVRSLGDKLTDVGEVLEIITDITSQTTLLALNAAIEAARAGEQGRAFSVVAEEVRRLADRSRENTRKIEGMIKEIEGGREDALASVDEAFDITQKSKEVIRSAFLALGEVANLVQTTAATSQSVFDSSRKQEGAVERIAYATQAVNSTALEIATNVEDLSASTQERAAGMEELTATAQELSQLSENLDASVSRFRS